jgi:hypothetical protein
LPEDGYAPATFGLEALKGALEKAGVDVLREVEEAYADELNDEIARKARPLILVMLPPRAPPGLCQSP